MNHLVIYDVHYHEFLSAISSVCALSTLDFVVFNFNVLYIYNQLQMFDFSRKYIIINTKYQGHYFIKKVTICNYHHCDGSFYRDF